jgi:hypothetical protein
MKDFFDNFGGCADPTLGKNFYILHGYNQQSCCTFFGLAKHGFLSHK